MNLVPAREYPSIWDTTRSHANTLVGWQGQFHWLTLHPASYLLADFDRVVTPKIQEQTRNLRAEVS